MEKTSISVGDLIKKIDNGQIVLPQFQRGYVWDKKQAIKYIDSLFNRYPTGSLLLWNAKELPEIRGENNINSTNSDVKVLLDGQQRLTSIYAIVKGCPPPFYDGKPYPKDIYINLEANALKGEEKFVYLTNGKTKERKYLSVTQVLNQGMTRFVSNLQKMEPDLRDYYISHLVDITNLTSILDYDYYEHIISSDWDLEQVVDIFNRVNAQGIRLGPPDFALAYICAAWPQGRDEIKKLLSDIQNQTGYDFDIEYIVRLISIDILENARLSKYNPDRDHLGNKFTKETICATWSKIKKAVPYSINILKQNCHFDNNENFSTFPFLVLWYFLIQGKEQYFKTDNEMKKMLLWFIEAQIWTRYTGPSESMLDKDIKLVKEKGIDGLINDLQKSNQIKPIQEKDIEGKGKTLGIYPLFCSTLLHNFAIDWKTGQKINDKNYGIMNKIELHHIFPKDYLKKNSNINISEGTGKQMVNEIANLAMITKTSNIGILNNAPKDYLNEIEKNYSGALESQFVPKNACLWDIKEFKNFLINRRMLLCNAMNNYIKDITDYSEK